MKKWLLLASLLVIIGGIGVAITWGSQAKNAEQVHEQEKIDPTNIESIEVKSTVSTIKMQPTDGDQIVVTLDGEYKNEQKGSLSVKTKDNTLYIQQEVEKKLFNFGFDFDMNGVTLLVEVPKKQWENIALRGDVGSIKVEDLEADSFDISSDVGSIKMNNLKATTFNVSSDVGSIKAYDTEGEFHVTNSTGSIYLEQNTLKFPITAESDVGSIKIKVKEQPTNAFIDASTDVGSINIFGEERSVKLGDGSIPVKLTTATGSITLDEL